MYERVFPVVTTPSRIVPDHIERPDYVIPDSSVMLPKNAEIKDMNQIRGMKRSCKLAANILAKLEEVVKVSYLH